MFKLILVASALAIVIGIGKFQSNDRSISPVQTNVFNKKDIALVKYKDTIYHCQGVIKTSCGHSIYCGNTVVHCVTDIQVEYLQ